MKQLFTFLFLALLASQSIAQAPESTLFQNWKVAKIGMTLGGDIEMPHGLAYRYLLNTAEGVDFEYEHLPFKQGTLTAMECDNPTFRLGISLSPPGNGSTEFRIAWLSIDGRIDMVHYETEDGQYLEVSAKNKETAFEAFFVKKHEFNRTLSLYGGAGMNIGYSHGGKVHVKGFLKNENGEMQPNDVPVIGEEFEVSYDQRGSINQRVFLQLGFGVKFLKRMEFILESGKGFGYRAIPNGSFNFTTLKRSLGLHFRYRL